MLSMEKELRKQYPDLEEKWKVAFECRLKLETLDLRLKNITLLERVFKSKVYIFLFKKYEEQIRLTKEATDDYELLKKLLWPAEGEII